MMTKLHFRSSSRRRSRGQALVEFALVLPVLLILLMVLIEVARLFSAWLIVENSARELHVMPSPENSVKPIAQPLVLVPTKPTREAAEDQARLLTIEDIARGAASGILVDYTAARDTRSFIDTVICSSRRDNNYQPKYNYWENPYGGASTTPHPRCVLFGTETKQEDAGGPGDRVTITVLFDHPLITPLRAITEWIPLLARRDDDRGKVPHGSHSRPATHHHGADGYVHEYANQHAHQHADRHTDAEQHTNQYADPDADEYGDQHGDADQHADAQLRHAGHRQQ